MELIGYSKVIPITYQIKSDQKNISLLVPGQGIFVFLNSDNNFEKTCSFSLMNKDNSDGLKITFDYDCVRVNRISVLDPIKDETNNYGLLKNMSAYYWFSLDSQNQTLYAGLGESRIETKVFKYVFNFTKERDDLRKANKLFLESLVSVQIESDNLVPLKLIRDPITDKIPLFVKDTSELTMDDIANGNVLPNANLSLIGQKLYNCVAGKKFILDSKDFPNFSKAIEYSIRTPGNWCYEKLKEKSTEFNKDKPDIKETYLRITLGSNNGESPGIPYVMEIWPVGHYSPIHNHASANALIRVLHGSINVHLFPFLSDKVISFGQQNFNKDDITWISPTLNQTHQLKNLDTNKDTCITIQCYMYDEQNKNHYDYFDFLDADGNIQKYEPDSDMDFIDFKNKMKEEWNNRPKRCF